MFPGGGAGWCLCWLWCGCWCVFGWWYGVRGAGLTSGLDRVAGEGWDLVLDLGAGEGAGEGPDLVVGMGGLKRVWILGVDFGVCPVCPCLRDSPLFSGDNGI
jgi:hypothetical protein